METYWTNPWNLFLDYGKAHISNKISRLPARDFNINRTSLFPEPPVPYQRNDALFWLNISHFNVKCWIAFCTWQTKLTQNRSRCSEIFDTRINRHWGVGNVIFSLVNSILTRVPQGKIDRRWSPLCTSGWSQFQNLLSHPVGIITVLCSQIVANFTFFISDSSTTNGGTEN